MKREHPKILFIDDDPHVLEGFVNLFSEDFSVLSAPGGKEALEILDREPEVGVVISDQRMPEMSGIELLNRIREKNPFITRILITAYTDYDAAVEAVNKAHIFYYVRKPYKFEELKSLIDKAIARHLELKEKAHEEKEFQKQISHRGMELVQNYTAGIAHHIKNPMVALRSFVEIFSKSGQMKNLDDEMKRLLGDATEGVKRINELIDLLVKISQCVLSSFQRTSLEKLVSLALSSDLQETLNAKSLRVSMKIPQELPDLYVDILSMQEAFREILKNAAQASENGRKITIAAEKARENGDLPSLKVEIEDEGCGIDPGDLKKIFDPFFKRGGDPQVKGLGLTFCQFIILEHGGSISVHSEPGRGTRVTVKLPAFKA